MLIFQAKDCATCFLIKRSSELNPANFFALVVLILLSTTDVATSQEALLAQDKIVTLDDVRLAVRPATDIVAGPIYVLTRIWQYIVATTSAAILISALMGALFTTFAIVNQRSTTRLRETFATINDDNWDKDVIASREIFGAIKNEIAANMGSITKYCHQPGMGRRSEKIKKCKARKKHKKRAATKLLKKKHKKLDLAKIMRKKAFAKLVKKKTRAKSEGVKARAEFMKKKIALETIMNDYENLALGIRSNTVDEVFLYRWMRGALLDDWDILSPMVTEFRHLFKRPETYIEFEGLASSWAADRSYRTGRKLKKAKRRISIR